MSTATAPDKTERYVDFDEYVEFQLEKTRKSIRSNDLLTATAVAAALVLAGLLSFVVLDHWVIPDGFSLAARWCWFLGFTGLVTGWLVWKVGVPALWTVNRLFAAKELEQADPLLKGNLLNWVDLRGAGRTVNASVMQTMEKQAATELSKMDVGQAVNHRPLLSASYALLAIVVLFCGYALLSPKKISSALWRILPFTEAGAVTRTIIQDVTPGDATLLARGQLEVGVVVAGEIPGEVHMLYSTSDGRVQDEAVVLRPETEGLPRFRGNFAGESGSGVLQDFSYFIVAGDAKSARYRVTVHHPPSATVHQVSLKSPDYMNFDDATNPGGHIDGWEGAVATISATSDKPCRSAVLQFLNEPQSPPTGEEIPVQVTEGSKLMATWKLDFRSDGTFPKHYRIQCRNDAGEVDPSPAVYNIAVRPDRPPEVALLYPERDLEAPANAVIPLLIEASDPDFELGYINLLVEKDGQSIHRSALSEGRQKSITLKQSVDLAALALQPGDEVQFWVEAFDNKQPRRNRKNTPRLKIQIVAPVSKDAAQQQLAENQQERDQRLAEAQQDQNRNTEDRNTDRPDEPDPKDDEKNQGERDPRDRNPDEPPQTADKSDGTKQDGGSKSANSRGESSDDPTSKPKDAQGSGGSEKGAASDDAASEAPLSDDGSQDDEALQRLNERLNPKSNRPSNKPSNKTDGDQNQSDPPSQTKPSPQPDAPAANNEPSEPKPTETGDTPPKNPGNPGKKPPRAGGEPSSEAESNPGEADSPDPSNSKDPMSGDDADPQAKPGEKPEGNSRKSRGKPPAGEESPSDPQTEDDTTSDQPEGTQPKKETQARSPSGKKPPKSEPGDNKSPAKTSNPDENDGDESVPMTKEGDRQEDSSEEPTEPAGKPGEKPSPSKERPSKKPGDKQPAASKDDPAGDKPDASPSGDNSPEGEPAPNNDDAQEAPAKSPTEKPNAGEKAKSPSQTSKSSSPKAPGETESAPMPGENAGEPGEDESASPSDPSSSGKPGPESKKNGPSKTKPPKNSPAQKPSGKSKDGGKESPAGDDEASESPSESASDGSENKRPGSGTESKPDDPKSPPDKGRKNPNAKKTELENPEETPEGDAPSPSARQKSDGSPNAADEKLKGKGKPDGQKSDQPQGGEAGGSKQDKEGNPGSKTEGPGEQTDKPGDETVSDEPTGKPDPKQRPGKGSKTKPGDKDQGGEPGDSGDKPAGKTTDSKSGEPSEQQDDSEGSESSQPGAGSKPSKSGKSGEAGSSPNGEPSASKSPSGAAGRNPQSKGSKPGNASNPVGGGASENGDVDGGGDAGDTPSDPEAANLEYNRQAAELVLQRLKDDLNNDQVDPKLLEELGWTPEQLERFVERLARQLEKPAEELTPQDEARRRQFEEMLKSLDLKHSGAKRGGGNDPQREIDQTGARRAPVPSEYKASWEALTKSLSKKNAPGKKDAAPKR